MRKAIAEQAKGKTSVIVLPVFDYVTTIAGGRGGDTAIGAGAVPRRGQRRDRPTSGQHRLLHLAREIGAGEGGMERRGDTFLNASGKCIYCDTTPLHPNRLTKEHVIPDGLRGMISITNGSCRACAKIINEELEGPILNNYFQPHRIYFNIHSGKRRSKKARPRTMRVHVEHNASWETVELSTAAQVLRMPETPFLFGPRSVLGLPMNYQITIAELGFVSPPGLNERLEALGGESVVQPIQFDFSKFSRFIAKIAHCCAAINQFDKMDPILGDYIIGKINPGV